MKKTTVSPKTLEMVLTAILAGLIMLMTFCGIGYIPINPVLMLTLHTLPVAVGSVVMGWKCGLILGGVFGLSSYLLCFGMDTVGTILCGVNPILCAIMCIVPRLICGVLPAFIYKAIKTKDKKGIIATPIACTSTAVINTIFFLSLMWIFFAKEFTTNQEILDYVGQAIDNIITLFFIFAGINAIIEAGICLVAGTAIVKALQSLQKRM